MLIKIERHYTEWRGNGNSSFRMPMSASTAWTESPKGALMQTSFACGQDFASRHPARGLSCPCDPDQPCAGWMAGTSRRSITTKGADPLPSTSSQPYAGWSRSRKRALPPSRPIPASGFCARHHDQRSVPAPCGIPAQPSAGWMPLTVSPVNPAGGFPPLRPRLVTGRF